MSGQCLFIHDSGPRAIAINRLGGWKIWAGLKALSRVLQAIILKPDNFLVSNCSLAQLSACNKLSSLSSAFVRVTKSLL